MSFIEISSYQQQGLDKKDILIQGIKTRGIGQLTLSGNLSASLRDSRDKIKAVTSRITPWGPVDKVLLNLLPSDLSKFSPQLELPITLATICLLWPKDLTPEQLQRIHSFKWAGSLSLSGDTHEFELLHKLKNEPMAHFKSIDEIWNFILTGEIPLQESTPSKSYNEEPLVECHGREYEKFWLQIAADAKVPVLMIGPPGVGKSHLARWALSCVKEPEKKLREEIDLIWSLAGKEKIPRIPFQNPHSRTHLSEFVGVARNEIPRPGNFSLAHGGLLILDEFPELARDSREILRNILDEKKVIKNTKAGFCTWPADFWLILTANPCPCGYAKGKDLSLCRCPENTRQKYISRFSGPLLDRVGVKLFLNKENSKLETPELRPVQTFTSDKEAPLSGLSPREKKLMDKLWIAFQARTEKTSYSKDFFTQFYESQRNFLKDWFVHDYVL